ncbi:anaerobic ribonucleoside triphosphate reductase [Mannheimia haemolytica]|uniref:Anaerobic ribonucleoside triphosphate reductase n=1 Tax=Mannheimia haemolytica TaxID=75985 RepID=A0A378MYI2_MANHA|nr:anaerobic ribonucleoside triphosphate reductase [Mannheimia haemolytica]
MTNSILKRCLAVLFFPDFEKPNWETTSKLQLFFMQWFNKERSKAILTFPVVTAAMLTEKGKCKDDEFANQMAKELSQGNSFFIYQSDNPDSLASCCRLRNEISDHSFSYSLGAGGVATGSINVITINMNRLVQDNRDLSEEVSKIHKYQYAYRKTDGRVFSCRYVAGLRCRFYFTA